MSLEIPSSSESSLSSDEYSEDDDEDLMNVAVSANKSPVKSSKQLSSALQRKSTAHMLPGRAPPRDVNKKKLLNKIPLNIIYKNISIKYINSTRTRIALNNRRKELIKILKEAAQSVIKDNGVTNAEKQQQEQHFTFADKSVLKLPELVCLDDTENEETPEKADDYNFSPNIKNDFAKPIKNAYNGNAIEIYDKNTEKNKEDNGNGQPNNKDMTININANHQYEEQMEIDMETLSKMMQSKEDSPFFNMTNEMLKSICSYNSVKMTSDQTNAKISQANTSEGENKCETFPIAKPTSTKTSNLYNNQKPIPGHTIVASDQPTTSFAKIFETPKLPEKPTTDKESKKRNRSSIKEETANVTNSPQGQTPPEEILQGSGEYEQSNKRFHLDPKGNTAFHNKARELYPEFNDLISQYVNGAKETVEKLAEKIKSIKEEIETINSVLQSTEIEWNRLLYLKCIKMELLQRLTRAQLNKYINNEGMTMKIIDTEHIKFLNTLLEEKVKYKKTDKEPIEDVLHKNATSTAKLITYRAKLINADMEASKPVYKKLERHYLNTKKLVDEQSNEYSKYNGDKQQSHVAHAANIQPVIEPTIKRSNYYKTTKPQSEQITKNTSLPHQKIHSVQCQVKQIIPHTEAGHYNATKNAPNTGHYYEPLRTCSKQQPPVVACVNESDVMPMSYSPQNLAMNKRFKTDATQCNNSNISTEELNSNELTALFKKFLDDYLEKSTASTAPKVLEMSPGQSQQKYYEPHSQSVPVVQYVQNHHNANDNIKNDIFETSDRRRSLGGPPMPERNNTEMGVSRREAVLLKIIEFLTELEDVNDNMH